MDWKAALALVKTQQQLLNELLQDSSDEPKARSIKRDTQGNIEQPVVLPPPFRLGKKRLVSPAADLFTSPNVKPTDADTTLTAAAPEDVQTCGDDTTSVVGSPLPDAEDIVATPVPRSAVPLDSPAEEEEEEEEAHEDVAPADTPPYREYANAESLVDFVLGDAAPPPVVAAAHECTMDVVSFGLSAEERRGRLVVESSEDVEWTALAVRAAHNWGKLECRCAAEHCMLDSMSAQMETLETLWRRFAHTCLSERNSAVASLRDR